MTADDNENIHIIIISKYPNTLGSTFGTKYFTSVTSTVLLILGDHIEKNQLMLISYLDKQITSTEIIKQKNIPFVDMES
jgi:hypothetical protein